MKKRKWLLVLLAISMMLAGCGETAHSETFAKPTEVQMKVETEEKIVDNTTNWLGGLTPDEALTYMKEHYDKGLVIVEVNTDYWKLKTGFQGAMHIPHDEMAERYGEIPKGKPVILHCGAGVVSVDAYKTLQEKRKDIPELSYIAGAPPVAEYNTWVNGREKTERKKQNDGT